MANLQRQAINERSPYWDNIKGILIFLVVFGHFIWDYRGLGLAGFLVSFIYIFHMPAFVFAAGYFSKSENSRSMRSLLKLLVIYLFFNTAIMLFGYFLFNRPLVLISPSYSYWFLISMVIWRLAIRHLEKIRNIFLISIVAAIFIGLWSDVTNVLAVARTIAFFPFFLLGYRLSKDKMNQFISSRKPIHYLRGILLLLAAACISSLFILTYKNLSPSDLLMEKYNSIDDMVVRIVLLAIAGLMTMGIVLTAPNKPLPFLCKWGRNSLVIYVLHRFITLGFSKAFPASGYDDVNLILALLGSIITAFLLGSDMLSCKFNRMINKITDSLITHESNDSDHRRSKVSTIAIILFIIFLSLPIITSFM